MPTPTASFLDVAARYGNVDPEDIEAVQHWFTQVLPTLPPEQIEEVFEDLVSSIGADRGKVGPRSYPKKVPFPSLSSSPAVPSPLLAAGGKGFLFRWRRRRP